ncbi:MAG TPA: hypothetical protein VEC09_02180 [Actinomycetota bacterium]|jgi:hypothetical protein|nr:hypothetical protein [Actinomycetota bacterium]
MTDNAPGGAPGSAKDAWSDVNERFASWGRLVADRYRAHPPSGAGEGGTSATSPADDAGRGLDDAARDVGDQLNRVFTALGDALRDAEAKAQLKDAVKALGDAVSLTVSETTEEIRRRVRSQDTPTDADGGTPPPPV